MRRLLLVLFTFLSLTFSVAGQHTVGIFTVPDDTTAFGRVKAVNTVIFDKSTGIFYKLTAISTATDTLTTASKVETGSPHTDVENDTGYLYRKGNATTEGSIRFGDNDTTGNTVLEQLQTGVWQPDVLEVGTGTLLLGPRVGLGAFGHHVATEDTFADHWHLHAHNVFDGETTTLLARIIRATQYIENFPVQVDYSGEFTGTSFTWPFTALTDSAFRIIHFKSGATAAVDTVRLQVWQGTDETGPLIFDQKYPGSQFPTNSDIALTLNGWMQVDAGTSYYNKVSSTSNISIKTNAAGTDPYLLATLSLIQEDDMLQLTAFDVGVSKGYAWQVGDWIIYNQKIYSCNTAGTQTGTFASNIALWDILGETALWERTGTTLSPKTAGDSVFIYEGANPICKLWDGDGNDAGTLSLYTGTTQYVHFSADEDSWITGGNLGIGDDDPLSDLHVRCNYPTPATTVGITLEQAGAGDAVLHYYLTGGQRIDTGIDNSTTNDDFVIGSGNFGVKYLSIDTPTNTVSVTNLNGNLVDGVTGTTQSADDNSTKIATTAYVDTAVSAEDLWDRSGTTLIPATTGDNITTTGDLTAANVTVGSNLGISQSGITNLVVGNTSGKSKMYFGQATNNNLVLEWTYDATPADAFARMTTWGYANDFYIDAKVLSLQTNNSA
ncbi:MAG: hypothetical protein GY710_06105, partial [Desulfobacteraceae bacterium]|nr:hypothetical protein [Desulfobacteraceae bacterium]